MAAKSGTSRREPITLVPAEDAQTLGDMLAEEPEDQDSDMAWVGWVDALREAQSKGKISAHKLPLDIDGNPVISARGSKQVLLGTYPHDQYNMEELCDKIRREFLKPGETAAIRFIGTQEGSRGIKLNKIVMLARAEAPGGESPSQLGEVLTAIQQSQQFNAQFMERIVSGNKPDPVPPAPGFDWKGMLQVMTPLLTPVIAAIANRMMTAPAANGPDLEKMLGVVVKLKELAGDGGGSGDDSNLAGIVKAVAPSGLQLLTALAQNAGQKPAPRPPRRLPAPTADLSKPSQTPAPNPAPRTSAPAAPSSEVAPNPPLVLPEGSDAMIGQIISQLEQLAPAADSNADPAEIVHLLLPMLPQDDALLDQLFAYVEDSRLVPRLALMSETIKKRQEWYERLRIALENEMSEPDSAGQPGVVPDGT